MKALIILITIFFINSESYSQWINLKNGIEGLSFTSIKCIDDSIIYIGTAGSGIYFSSDNGNNWEKRNSGLLDLKINTIEIYQYSIFAGSSNGILFKSTDKGNNWIKLFNGLPKNSIWSIAVDNNHIFVGTRDSGLYFSNDYGQTFLPKNKELIYIKSLKIKNDTLFAGTFNSGFNVFPIGNNTWLQRNSGLEDPDIRTIYILNDMIYVGTSALGVFESNNNGINWRNFEFSPTNFYSVWAINSINDNFIFGCYSQGVFLANKSFLNWKEINEGLSDLNIIDMIVNSKFIFAIAKNGLYRLKISEIITNDIIKSSDFQEKISISPNPASDYIFVYNVIQSEAKNPGIEIFNVYSESLTITPPFGHPFVLEGEKIKIDISNLPAGVYFIRVGDKFEKFIKM